MKRYNLYNNVLGWLCFVIAAVTYLLTIEPTASFWDCPEFISQGAKLEVGHPPGNPIFMLAARFFVTLFGCSITGAAVAVNCMSALLSAATILLLFWTITHLVRRMVVPDDATDVSLWQMVVIFAGGICGALAYTWSDTFWFSAVEGEVYAFSSFCTALVVWLIFKWENRADLPHSDRYLILIAYIIGVSIAVHLLNLLCIPAIVLVFYYRKFKNVNAKGSLIALGVSFVIVALILFGLVPGFVKVAQWFELLFVNGLGFGYNMGVLFYTILLVAVFIWTIRSLYVQRSPGAIKTGVFLSVVLSGMPFIGSTWLTLILVAALAIYLFGFCNQIPVRIFNVAILSIFLIFVGYSSYALLLIRSHANTPMNQNAPDNVFALSSYLNREQYGETPLFYGAVFAEKLVTQNVGSEDQPYYVALVDENGRPSTQIIDGVLRDDEGNPYSDPKMSYRKVVKVNPNQPDEYVETMTSPGYSDIPDLKMFLPRIYSNNDAHVRGYKGWSQYTINDFARIPTEVRDRWAAQGYAPLNELSTYLIDRTKIATHIAPNGTPYAYDYVWKPGFADNIRYFFNYQFNHMYWRYFMWNFAGRQNDLQGNGEPHLGNWISGIPFIDNMRLGDQSLLPDEYGKGNKGHNVFFMLPLLLGIAGLLWQAFFVKKDAPGRGIEQFWVVCFFFLMTGIAIVLYLNQTPGQPRERDYAFAGSFYAFAIWIGMGIPAIAVSLRKWLGDKATAAIAAVVALAIPLQMVSQTWDDHDRSGRYTARDFGMNYLSSVAPNGIIFCNGDNDTFPLWYAQEVEGYRTDIRVVNLSYLTTDWYANQQRIPSYDGAAIPMYATPADYAGDRLAYSFVYPISDSVFSAREALADLYSTPSDPQLGGQAILLKTKIAMPVDSVAALAAFGCDTTRVADRRYMIPTVGPIMTDVGDYASRYNTRGINLGNVLALDIIANSADGNFARPVYFASTVPNRYYMNLDSYMYSTGMASVVTPFYDAEVSPLLDTAYANIVERFRWGGLDCEHPEDLYLDETVRRMVSSTRSAIYSIARELANSGDLPASQQAIQHALANGYEVPANRYDMARNLLNLMLAKLPANAAPLDGQLLIYTAETFYDLYVATGKQADLDTARSLAESGIIRFAQFTAYAAKLPATQRTYIGYDIDYCEFLAEAIGILNRIDILNALSKDPAQAEFLASWAPRDSYDLHPSVSVMLYVDGTGADTLNEWLPKMSGTNARLVQSALYTLDAASRAGFDVLKRTNDICTQYGIDRATWQYLL